MQNELDNDILNSFGGNADSHSFIRIISAEPDLNNKDDSSSEENEPCIIRHSSYHDFAAIACVLENNRNKFSIFSLNIQSISAKW